MSYETYLQISNLTTTLLQVLVLAVLLYRRLYRTLPWFTLYIVYLILFTFALSIPAMVQDPSAYYLAQSWGNCITLVLSFMVIVEVFRNSLQDYISVRKTGLIVLISAGVLTLAIALVLAPYGGHFASNITTDGDAVARTFHVLQRSVRIVQIGMLVALFAFSSFLALSWRNYNFGIALGYGLYAAVNLSTTVALGYFDSKRAGLHNQFAFIDSTVYRLVLILWATYLWRANRGETNHPPPASGGTELEEWNETLKALK